MAKLNLGPILDELAAGKITAEEASRRIEELKRVAAEAKAAEEEINGPEEQPQQEGAKSGALARISVKSVGRRVRIEGDSSVSTLVVDGPHVLRRIGTTMEVQATGEVGPSFGGFSIVNPPRSFGDFGDIALGKELLIRVNPRLIVDVEVTTGGLKTSHVPHLGRIRVTAGGSTLEDVVQIEDLLSQAGGVSVEGPISVGRSRLRVESGALTINLTKGANVSIRGEASLGRISWPGDTDSAADEVTVGAGAARMDVSVLMGMATIRSAE
ncbi:hypothetical protein [Tessaracoccus caeni]|uniref:hypothetical protein n=1 Tax=Tessaracoccus caeni TaxID=3031239 RepID=UPI0023DA3276|nr:hypothetical protein [Tessaracoccus caeni]MDF1489139.1 hypothetical protein [Tessaracoccus caeni]